jgi:Fe-S-cluster containining protein
VVIVRSAPEAELATLCRACGLCCDGSLFGRVDFEPDEVPSARRRGLRVLPNGKGFEQPCDALASSAEVPGERCCRIYDERPRACRRFTCLLYDRHLREGGAIEDRIAVVRRVRELLALLEASGLGQADFERSLASAVDPRVARAMDAYVELMRTLEDDFARAR